jgi:isoamyl acetate esterase
LAIKKSSDTGDAGGGGGVSNVAFCTVFFGANDAALPGQRQHVPIDQYQQNLVTIVKHIQATLACCGVVDTSDGSLLQQPQQQNQQKQRLLPIILLTPPPFDAEAWMKHKGIDSPGRSNDVAREYGERVKLVAAQVNNDTAATTMIKCAVIDTWNLLHGASTNKEHCYYSQYLSDGLHLNEAGNRIVYDAIMDVLQREFPHVAPAAAPTISAVVPSSQPDDETKKKTNGNHEPVVLGLPLEEPLWDELC